MRIKVDDFWEDDYIMQLFAKSDGYDDVDKYIEDHYAAMLKIDPDYFKDEQETLKHQKHIYEHYSDKFDAHSDFYSGNPKESLYNPLAGADVLVPLGEGLLDFCYADFREKFEECKSLYFLFSEEFSSDFKKALGADDAEITREKAPLPIRNTDEAILAKFRAYEEAMLMFSSVIEGSLYTLINPPALYAQNKQGFIRFHNYLLNLQDEILEMIQFCYDENFYPTLLKDKHPAERFGLFLEVKGLSSSFTRTEIFEINPMEMSGSKMPFGLPSEEFVKKITSPLKIDDAAFAEFINEFQGGERALKFLLRKPSFIYPHYQCTTVYDMLMFEFTKMLEYDMRFEKCKNCGRYFIMKGNYQTDYCDRISNGETKTCQTIASLKNYREKVKTSGAWTLYNKYYKRYFAHMRTGNIEPDKFKQWQYQATAMRDRCADGEVLEKDFELWLHGSFVNRKLKER